MKLKKNINTTSINQPILSRGIWPFIVNRPLLIATILLLIFALKTFARAADFTPKNIINNVITPKTAVLSSSNKKFLPDTFQAKFEQSFTSIINNKTRTGNGTLSYQYPGHLRFEVTSPNTEKSIFISNPDNSWYYTPPFDEDEKGEVLVQKSNKMFIVNFFDALKGGLVDNTHYTVSTVSGNIPIYHITFRPKTARKIGIKSANISFDGKVENKSDATFSKIKSIEITYQDDKKVLLLLSELKEDTVFASNHFEFKIPPNTKVVDN
ncbi:MAG: outer membrane lipoprotein carrier protein LolA [Oligoflexia bacterium]|nr:outer membrane lipoprotein carrier protein LolA [Oligoflexia bacterium]